MPQTAAARMTARQWREYRRFYDRWIKGKGPKPPSPQDALYLDSMPLLQLIADRTEKVWQEAYWEAVARSVKNAGSRVPSGKGLSFDTAGGFNQPALYRNARWMVASYIAAATDIEPASVHQQLLRWAEGSRVNVYVADRVCSVFGKHISEVYGDEWEDKLDLEYPDEPEAEFDDGYTMRVEAGPVWQLIDELVAAGWTKAELARRLGYKRGAIQLHRTRVRRDRAEAVVRLHAQLSGTQPPVREKKAKPPRVLQPRKAPPRRTHCAEGHEMAGDNLLVQSGGVHRCRTCYRRTKREAHARRRDNRAIKNVAYVTSDFAASDEAEETEVAS